ncbi:carboxypeptidase-like regulatory domain-containing protein [Pedobacter sp. JY14-1]|uniref:carboxypeptidase-like regulatory domain-containing protein n=1 Tax=Pedobacter sp. JY14-1 TaxID=3034151 RepID=UPI0023E1AB7A|nr:carboxypeptidase-like regulatory domain-containing protein [Pedobacter sp. JY14-1]
MTTSIKTLLLFLFASFQVLLVNAQSSFNIEGRVLNEKGEALKSATVFINGSQKITVTDEEGKFKFEKLAIGTFPLVVNMLGYFSYVQEVQLVNKNVVLDVVLKEKTFALDEIVISPDTDRDKNYKLFKKSFLGTSKNAKDCKILNDSIIKFGFNKKEGLLKASTDDFLIVENRALGYRIKYLLKTFQFNVATTITIYDGQAVFEELNGTKKEKLKWQENRKKVYYGSFMHFLRSVYQNTVLKEGFLAHHVFSSTFYESMQATQLSIDPRPVRFDTIVNIVDSAFVSLKFSNGLYVNYEPRKASKIKSDTSPEAENIFLNYGGTSLKLYLNEALIDEKGSLGHYNTFFIEGFWGEKRLGDQLPFEYHPDL